MENKALIPHLFRTEYSKLTAVLCRYFGLEHIETAEDIASDTFLSALETWPYRGVPGHPVAWLYAVAKNKAKNRLQRDQVFARKISAAIKADAPGITYPEIDLSDSNISDSQLQMLFAVCHPAIPAEAQVGLSLRILCGFGIEEIANAFLSNKETINKRLFRAKETLRQAKIQLEMPPDAEIGKRLENVLTTLYLLYNEGYYSETQDAVIREDLCLEAMRLMQLLLNNPATDQPAVNALYALMCFHASRFAARRNKNGGLLLYGEQDEALWDQDLISKGAYFLNRAAQGDKVTAYHLEAGIAYWHTIKSDTPEKWEAILQLYNRLLQINYSPVAALNRTFALFKTSGREAAIAEAEKLRLENNHYYHFLLGELYTGHNAVKARAAFERALLLSNTAEDKRRIGMKLDLL